MLRTMTITVSHSPAEGTLVTGDPRPHHGVLKELGFRWSRNLDAWYLPHSRDKDPQTWKIDRARDGLTAAGLTVDVEISDDKRTPAEREAERADRAAARTEHLESRAERLHAESDARYQRARQEADLIPFGQPILVGHHSEGRHRKALARIDSNFSASFAAQREAEEAERRAQAATSTQSHREAAGTTLRRIDRFEADLRKIGRTLAGKPCPVAGKGFKADAEVTPGDVRPCPLCKVEHTVTEDRKVGPHYMSEHDRPPSGRWLERLNARKAGLEEEITYWKAHVAQLEADGEKIWTRADFKPGDKVRTRSGWGTVVKTNPKTLSVDTGVMPWPLKYEYSAVIEKRDAGTEGG